MRPAVLGLPVILLSVNCKSLLKCGRKRAKLEVDTEKNGGCADE